MLDWAEIRRRVLLKELSKRAACREYDLHWSTLSRILDAPTPPALGIEACGQGKRVRFARAAELATQLLEPREERRLSRMRVQLAKLDLLILDELGYVPASKAGSELLFDVISAPYERSGVIVTTNLPFEQWTEVLDNERLTGAALDRSTHRCHIIETGGESYRLRDARCRREGSVATRPTGSTASGPEQTATREERSGE